jgi:5-formyltetrahydrofolate cyclo-ligase
MYDKGSLRTHYLELLKKQSSIDRDNKSREIADKLFAHAAFQKAQVILFYASLPGEVETFAMMERAIQLKKRVALPIIVRDQRKMIPILTDSLQGLENGTYGISEPRLHADKALGVDQIDAVIVPGLAFDKANNRLGRGAGYYDRFLAELPDKTATIGLAFDFQLSDCLPKEGHDVPLRYIIAN